MKARTQTITLMDAVFPQTNLMRGILVVLSFTILIALSARISLAVPWSSVPITGQTFASGAQVVVSMDAGALALSGQGFATDQVVGLSAGALSLSGLAPSLDQALAFGVGALALAPATFFAIEGAGYLNFCTYIDVAVARGSSDAGVGQSSTDIGVGQSSTDVTAGSNSSDGGCS